jgi:hypothetical protein
LDVVYWNKINGVRWRSALLRPDAGLGLGDAIGLLEHLDAGLVHAEDVVGQQALAQ